MRYLIRFNENVNYIDLGWQKDAEGFFKTFNFSNYSDALDFVKDASSFTKLEKVIIIETDVTIWTADETKILEIDEISKTTIALTKMEQKIFAMIKQGKTYKEISDELGISFNTVNFHIKNIYRKMGVNSKMALVSGRYKNK